MSNPFSTFRVTPAWGRRRAAIEWRLEGAAADVYFYRSIEGTGTWELLNPNAPANGTQGNFIDGDLDPGGMHTRVFYRGLVDPAGGGPETWLKGPPVTALDFVHPRQLRSIHAIVNREFRAMAGPKGDGVPVFHLIPRTDGNPVSWYDPETGQLQGMDCPDSAEDTRGYGQIYQGGFYAPFQTWVTILAAGPHLKRSNPDMTKDEEKADVRLRFLAFPRPDRGHMIVLPGSDMRYLVGDAVEPFFFPGTTVPIAWEAGAQRMEKDDPRHSLVMPALLPLQV